MSLFKRSTKGLFASESLIGHLLRGGIGIALMTWAIQHQTQTALCLVAAAGALFAFRGCPICWSIGLFESLKHKFTQEG